MGKIRWITTNFLKQWKNFGTERVKSSLTAYFVASTDGESADYISVKSSEKLHRQTAKLMKIFI